MATEKFVIFVCSLLVMGRFWFSRRQRGLGCTALIRPRSFSLGTSAGHDESTASPKAATCWTGCNWACMWLGNWVHHVTILTAIVYACRVASCWGCKGEKICFMLDESVLEYGFLESMNTLLTNGDIPGLFEGDKYLYTTLMTQDKEGARPSGKKSCFTRTRKSKNGEI